MKTAIGVALVMSAAANAAVSFNRDVRPILSDRCFTCHGPDAANRGIKLRLDSDAAAKADLGGRFAVKPGDAAGSELIKRITAEKPAMRMPPIHSGLKLSAREIETLRSWIDEGARWEKHWSLIPPARPELPSVSRKDWPKNPIDAFVLARLDREGLAPSTEASRTTLIRRVTLDLTGIPPTPAEVDAFLADTTPGAYDKLIDRLLASRRYGERMAIRWLDAARYADTNGYQTDAERDMFRWRDWVIDAFNSNKPYDRFVVEQLAGDLLPNATLDQKIATGFNRNHRGNSEGGIVPEEYLVEYAVDRVETMSTVFLGLTVGCARCHNHKYDPITQRDFYSLIAYFNNIPELGRYLKYGNTPPFVQAPTQEQQRRLAVLDRDVAQAEQAFASAEAHAQNARVKWEKALPRGTSWSVSDGLVVAPPLTDTHFDGKRMVEAGDKGNFGFYSKFTLSARVNAANGDGPLITRAEDDDEGKGYGLYLENGKLQANFIARRLDDSIRVQTASALPLNSWHTVTLSYDGSRVANGVRIYIDGQPQKLEIILDAINQEFSSKEPLRVGGGGAAGRRFTGEISSVRVYDRALTDQEVAMVAVEKTLDEIARTPASQRSAAQSSSLRYAFLESDANPPVTQAYHRYVDVVRKRSAFLESVPTVMVMQEMQPAKETFLLLRGAYDKPGDRVSRRTLEALPALEKAQPDRLGLAEWLVSPSNPLTARVAVNRYWQMYFGVGLVKTTEDFGVQGEWPSNPELLDWLATEFVRSGWDVKALQKTILTSATYRQSSNTTPELSQRDPENRLLARGPRVRLPAEMVRDQALAVSGLLVDKQGGPSVRPYQPAGLWSELGGADYKADTGEGLYRRSLYTFWKRTAPPPFMANFDSPLRESCTVRESRTDTPLQALNLMNDVTFVEASRRMAARVWKEGGSSTPERLNYAFRLTTSRQATPSEMKMLASSLAWQLDYYKTHSAAAAELLALGASPRDTTIPVADHAAWTAVCSLLMNLDEVVTKE